MQTDRFEVGGSDLASPPLHVAREAYLNGDLVACLAVLDGASELSAAGRREAILLRARVLLREHRVDEVVELLGPVLGAPGTVDEACTARMLHAVAVARSGSADRGLALLGEVEAAARTLCAHRTIRAEISYWTAFAHWTKRDYRATLEHAIVAEGAREDVVSVRAASLRGFVAVAKERYPQALALFRSALEAYRMCRERDADLAERVVAQIASLEVTLRSATVVGTHALPPEIGRLTEVVAPQRAPGVFRMAISAMDGWLFAFDDDRRPAYRKMRIAEGIAPTSAWRVWAIANCANIALAFGESDAGAEFAAHALEIADAVAWDATSDEERVGLLFLAEALAQTDPPAAVVVLRRYDGLTTSIDRSLLFRDDVRLWIVEMFVRGLVHRILGERREAWEAFKGVYDAARRVGCLWRAALALIELDATPLPTKPRGDFYLEAAAKLVNEHFPRSFLVRRLGRWMAMPTDTVVAGLARVPREVLRHLLDGRSQKEIAAAMGLAPGTVKNYVNGLHRSFAVVSTPQLLVTCYRRGLGVPSWESSSPRRAV